MNTNTSAFMRPLRSLYQRFLSLSLLQKGLVVGAVLLLIYGVVHFSSKPKVVEAVTEKARKVTMSRVADLATNASSIPLVGTVTSRSEATIRAEASGKLTRVNKKLGDYVSAGQIIAQFENSAERAALQQAEGAYESAKAARELVSGTTAITNVNNGTSNSALKDAQTNTVNTIASAYISMDDAIRAKTDPVFNNPQSAQPSLIMFIPDTSLKNRLESQRVQLEAMLKNREEQNKQITVDSDLKAELVTLHGEVEMVKSYLTDLARAYSIAVSGPAYSQTSIDTQKSVVSITRTSISGTLTSIIGAQTALTNSAAAQEVAGQTVTNTGASIASADAAVKSALGAYNGALSRLEKTIIRSPISGTLNSISISTGDFVTPSAQVAVVSNNGALEVLSYISEDDAYRVSVGMPVAIGTDNKGIITRVASALDPVTKKIEVRVAITGDKTELINGQSVHLEIIDPARKQAKKTNIIQIPLSAVKITPQGSFVFTLSASSTVEAKPIELGVLSGDFVRVTKGLTQDMVVVRDARGLKDGMAVDSL